MYACACVREYICMYVCMYVCMRASLAVWTHTEWEEVLVRRVCMYVSIYVCMYVCMALTTDIE